MSNCPYCGAGVCAHIPTMQDYPEQVMFECGQRSYFSEQAASCRIPQLTRDLQQANAVIDAINTLLENGGDVGILVLSSDDGISVTARVHGKDSSCHAHDVTLREALAACVAARDQHDRERRDP